MSCSCEKNEISKKILEMMKESGAHLQGHFKLTSGLHSDNYMPVSYTHLDVYKRQR